MDLSSMMYSFRNVAPEDFSTNPVANYETSGKSTCFKTEMRMGPSQLSDLIKKANRRRNSDPRSTKNDESFLSFAPIKPFEKSTAPDSTLNDKKNKKDLWAHHTRRKPSMKVPSKYK